MQVNEINKSTKSLDPFSASISVVLSQLDFASPLFSKGKKQSHTSSKPLPKKSRISRSPAKVISFQSSQISKIQKKNTKLQARIITLETKLTNIKFLKAAIKEKNKTLHNLQLKLTHCKKKSKSTRFSEIPSISTVFHSPKKSINSTNTSSTISRSLPFSSKNFLDPSSLREVYRSTKKVLRSWDKLCGIKQ